jgi:predicted ATP-grasp superfamily ATP-dependent carboligase
MSTLPPVILLGGEANAVSVARSLGRLGVAVYALNEPGACVRFSRYCRGIDLPDGDGDADVEESWARFLLGPGSDPLQGAVVLTCSDAGIQVLNRHRAALAARFRLDAADPGAQRCMLDKLDTYRVAQAAGVATPRFWIAESRDQIERIRDDLVFPLLVKPRLSHVFEERFGRKYALVDDLDALRDAFSAAVDAGVGVMLVEWIPGPDDRLCSYYTYIDDTGEHLFHFTKRIIRRYPFGMGAACYHITDWNPELIAPARALFRQAGLRGLANVEFKRDPRDGQLKLIECNARFTASNCLVAASGFDLAAFVYNRIVGRPQPPLEHYTVGLRLWDPIRDLASFQELRARGELSFGGWLASVLHPQTFPFFCWSDPLPALARAARRLRLRPRRRSAPVGTTKASAHAPESREAELCQTS